MPHDEYIKWAAYFEARPVGWREDDRTFKLLAAQGVKEKAENLFASLAKMKENEVNTSNKLRANEISVSNLKRSALFSRMLGATGGDTLDIFK